MIECVSINLPNYYTRLLQVDMHSTGKNFENLGSYIFQHPGFHGLIENSFQDIPGESRVSYIVKAMGWHGLRDRLAGVFLYYKLNNRFPISLTDTWDKSVADLLEFEEKVKEYTPAGHSRGFLLAFYLKMAKVHWNSKGVELKNLPVIDDELIQTLSYAKAKILKIDWVLLLLAHFRDFLGIFKLQEALDRGTGYQDLSKSLSLNQQEVLVENLLSYGSSIEDDSFFIPIS